MNDRAAKTVRSVMASPPISVEGLASVAHAIDLMRRHYISSLIIDKRHDGDEYGLLTVTDIAHEIIGEDRPPERTSVYQIMSKPVVSLDIDMELKYAVRLLDRFGLSRALVTEKSEVVGMVTLRDMVLRHLEPEEAGEEEA